MELVPAVLQAVPGEDFTVYAYCNDGAVRLVDVKPLLAQGGVFQPLNDPVFFAQRLTVLNRSVAWDIAGNWDATACVGLDPYTVFAAPVVDDPLEAPSKAARPASPNT